MKTILDLVKANVELNTLSSKLDEAVTANETANTRLEELSASHAEESAKLGAQHAEEIASLESKIQVLEEANLLLEEKQTSADEKAVEIAASVGVESPVEEAKPEPTQEASIDALWEQYNAIEGKQERRSFYINNIKERI
jgi:hypothetical protein